MQKDRMGRREMLTRTVQLTVLGSAAPALLAACGGGELTCTDASGLPEPDRQARLAAQYVDRAPDPTRSCERCSFFQAGPASQCATCTIVRGPIHPEGTCQLWAAASP